MKRVSTQGSGKGIFGPNYPISVASKTGTAEKVVKYLLKMKLNI